MTIVRCVDITVSKLSATDRAIIFNAGEPKRHASNILAVSSESTCHSHTVEALKLTSNMLETLLMPSTAYVTPQRR